MGNWDGTPSFASARNIGQFLVIFFFFFCLPEFHLEYYKSNHLRKMRFSIVLQIILDHPLRTKAWYGTGDGVSP